MYTWFIERVIFLVFYYLRLLFLFLDARCKIELSFLQTLRHVSSWVSVTHEINEHQSPTKINDSTVVHLKFQLS